MRIKFTTTKHKYDCHAPTAYNFHAALGMPLMMCVPGILWLLGDEATDVWLGALFLAFAVIVLLPFNCFMHLAMKPDVRLDGHDVVMGAAGMLELRKRCTECRMTRHPDGTYGIRFFPWFANVMPGGAMPSRMRVIPRARDAELWERVYRECEAERDLIAVARGRTDQDRQGGSEAPMH